MVAQPANGNPLTRRADSAHSLDAANALLAAQDHETDSWPEAASDAAVAKPSHYWTGRLLTAGFTIEECQQIRSLSREAILEHIELLSH